MRLDNLAIKNFRKLKDCTINFRDATFLIGSNNAGKSSVFRALQLLHQNINPSSDDYSKCYNQERDDYIKQETIEIIGEYHNIPDEAETWIGFKGRIIRNEHPLPGETNNKIVYRKVWSITSTKPEIFIMEKNKNRSEKYVAAQTPEELEGDDFSIEFLIEHFGVDNLSTSLNTKANKEKANELPQLWDVVAESTATWVKNPGGIPGNIISRLPKVIIIPAESCMSELTSQNGALLNLLGDLFKSVRNKSDNYTQAQQHLSLLAREMNPQDRETDFGRLIQDLNSMAHSLFPNASIHVTANLDDADKVIKPLFNVEMESNVRTSVSYQGHGIIRCTAFQLIRFIQDYLNAHEESQRSTILCFEEPEIYLHPAAASQMRDTIYQFASGISQIVATTHSPYMINLGSDTSLSLTKFSVSENDFTSTHSFNLEQAFTSLQENEKLNLKMLLKIDDYIARIFFTNKCIFVEGDTEEVVLRETIKKLSPEQKSIAIGNCEILRARGKAVMISMAKYLNALEIDYIILHDSDVGTPKAELINPLILAETGETRRIMVNNCIEDLLGYEAPSKDKPYKAYNFIQKEWGADFSTLPQNWREIFLNLHSPYLDHLR